jgi:hypothetical protein
MEAGKVASRRREQREELGIRENDFERQMSEEVADVSRRKKCD